MPKKLNPATVKKFILRLAKVRCEIRRQIEEVKARCAHEWRYERDPSGNNDTGWWCEACGACGACGAWTRTQP